MLGRKKSTFIAGFILTNIGIGLHYYNFQGFTKYIILPLGIIFILISILMFITKAFKDVVKEENTSQ